MMAIVSATGGPASARPTACRLKYDGSWMRSRKGWSRAVADGVARVLAARALDGDAGAAGRDAHEARQLGHDRPVGHLVEHLVDDADALADLVDVEQVARVRVAFGARRDVELELRVDAVRVRAADVVGHAGGAQRRAGDAQSAARSRGRARPGPCVRRTKISFSLMSCACSLDAASPARLIQSPRRLRKSWLRSPLTPPMRR